MRAVVLTVCVPLDSLMGIHMVLLFERAVITWFTVREEYINSSSQVKNPQVPWRLHSQVVFITQFQGLEDFSLVLTLSLQGLNIHFNG